MGSGSNNSEKSVTMRRVGHQQTGGGPGHARLKDVAALADVSTATVARVLHNNGYVSSTTRARVEAAIEQTGYRVNAVAQGLRRQRTMTIGQVVTEILPNPVYAEVAMGVERTASELGYASLIATSDGQPDKERRVVDTLLARQVDAVVFTSASSVDNVQLVVDSGVPVVEASKPLHDGTSQVLVDNFAGVLEAVQHLIALGHRSIGFLGEPHEGADRVTRERHDAFKHGLAEAGVEYDQRRVVRGEYWRDEGWPELRTGVDYMSQLLSQDPGVTAVLATSDLLAAGALQALGQRGIRVPDDVSVIGHDDTLAPHLAPALTTVQLPLAEIGEKAAHLAVAGAGGAERSTVWCAGRLTLRNSTGPAPR